MNNKTTLKDLYSFPGFRALARLKDQPEHPGLLATVLDEAMIKAAWGKGLRCVTGEMTVRYMKPARTPVAYRVIGRVTGEKKDKMVFAESEIIGADGGSVARATGKLFRVRE